MEAAAQPRPLVSQRWIFTLTVAFLYAACVLRSLLEFDGALLLLVLTLLAVWLVLLLTQPSLSRRWKTYFPIYVSLQAIILAVLLTRSDGSDTFAVLLAVPTMEAVQRWPVRRVAALIGLFAVLVFLCLEGHFGVPEALALAIIYTGLMFFLASYALTAKRATEARERNDRLAGELRQTNRRLVDYADRAERLAGARERQRLARDLHDSATQTLFSMTLTARSASLLLGRSPDQVANQLDQIDQLARSALSEMDALSAELPPSPLADGGLTAALRRHLGEREQQGNLRVALEVDGDEALPPADEAALLRIAQEALNNVVKHAGTSEAVVRVRLRRPFRLEVEDRGEGFDAGRPPASGMGLSGMRERADEIGWRLTVTSAPGSGTRVVAEETQHEGGRERVPD